MHGHLRIRLASVVSLHTHTHTHSLTHKYDDAIINWEEVGCQKRNWYKSYIYSILTYTNPNFPIIQGLNSVWFSPFLSFCLFQYIHSFRLIHFLCVCHIVSLRLSVVSSALSSYSLHFIVAVRFVYVFAFTLYSDCTQLYECTTYMCACVCVCVRELFKWRASNL